MGGVGYQSWGDVVLPLGNEGGQEWCRHDRTATTTLSSSSSFLCLELIISWVGHGQGGVWGWGRLGTRQGNKVAR
jgi:hypothetical protein